MSGKLSYHKSVDYSVADPAKVMAQKEGRATAKNLPFGFSEVAGTRGESAYVFNMGEMYGALVQEGLGTKSLIAQAIYKKTGKSYFAQIAQDTVATFINDLISVGATPVVTNAYWSSSSYDWLADHKLTEDFIQGWRAACDEARVVWGGGETQALSGIVQDGVLEFAGSAFGVIKPKNQLVSDEHLRSGDSILLLASSGVHANGISLARELADKLPQGYETKLPAGATFGKALLTPTYLYAKIIRNLFDQGLDIHYLSNVTGHGWRKLMRGRPSFSYVIEEVPPVQEIFSFIAEYAKNDETEMYSTYNMGAGYAVYLPHEDALKAKEIAQQNGIDAWIAGTVTDGPKKVVIQPKNITFAEESLEVR
jgi:phosphoribosylformylglycinamidine cyclo-ligase